MQTIDTVVIGSGFGGAVMACRLAEKGARVVVLERGRRWRADEYPSVSQSNWLWDDSDPKNHHGWLDFRYFGDMSVAMGAGVGGGSLIYANVSIDPGPDLFEHGWPAAIRYEQLQPHYREVGRMLGLQRQPENQWTPRTRLMREAAAKIGAGDRFRIVEQAITFDPDWSADQPGAYDYRRSRRWTNEHGVEQGTCVHCGNCDIGCPVLAKNTLDLNYLARAEAHGADIRPLHQVRCIAPEGSGYRVLCHDLVSGTQEWLQAERVIVACGSIGSTELLLRCRDQYRTLPKLSHHLGRRWSPNGDFLTLTNYPDREIEASRGPTISSAIDFLDGSDQGQRFLVEDGGFPDLVMQLVEYLEEHRWSRSLLGRNRLAKLLKQGRRDGLTLRHLMPWFGQAQDRAGGHLYLGRRWYMPWRRDRLKMHWDYHSAEQAVGALADIHRRLSEATGGEAVVPPTWSLLHNLVTPHPLGGCGMADSAEDGVVDDRGEVHGYPNLFVMDGSVIPRALGLNPSRTIATLAEYSAARLGTSS